MVPDGRNGRTEGRTHGQRQNYIPPTSSGDKNSLWSKGLKHYIEFEADNIFKYRINF